MNRTVIKTIALGAFVLGAWQAQAQDAKTPYPSMAPPDQYLIADRNAEIALARGAAPPSISEPATEFIVPVSEWSDGTPADSGDHAH